MLERNHHSSILAALTVGPVAQPSHVSILASPINRRQLKSLCLSFHARIPSGFHHLTRPSCTPAESVFFSMWRSTELQTHILQFRPTTCLRCTVVNRLSVGSTTMDPSRTQPANSLSIQTLESPGSKFSPTVNPLSATSLHSCRRMMLLIHFIGCNIDATCPLPNLERLLVLQGFNLWIRTHMR